MSSPISWKAHCGLWLAAGISAWLVGGWTSVRGSGRQEATVQKGHAETRRDAAGNHAAASSPDRIAAIFSMPDANGRLVALLEELRRMPADRFPEMMGLLDQSGLASLRKEERVLVIQEWAARDPLAAAEWLERHGRKEDLEPLMYVWALHDPDAALAWATSVSKEDLSGGSRLPDANLYRLKGIFAGIAATSSDLGRSFLSRVAEDDLYFSVCAVSPAVIELGFEGALKWMEALPDQTARNIFIMEAAEPLAAFEPARLAAWVNALENEGLREVLAKPVARVWGQTDPTAAQNWVSALPPGMGRDDAVIELTDTVTLRDPKGTLRWLQTFPESETLEVAKSRYASRLSGSDPAAALAFLPSFVNEDSRLHMQDSILSDWSSEDPRAAKAWVRANREAVPPEEAEQILQLPDEPAE